MGYDVKMGLANFTIPADKLDAACQALKDLNHSETAVKGGRQFGKGEDGKYGVLSEFFSWMPEDYDQHLHTAKEIFEKLGFKTSEGEDGSLSLTGFEDKQGDEAQFLEAVAPFVPAGSYIDWIGEDNGRWQCHFDGSAMIVTVGEVIYS